MSDPDEYRQHAVDCMARAQRAKDEASRAAWLEMAQYWLQFSESSQAKSAPVVQQQQQIQSKAKDKD